MGQGYQIRGCQAGLIGILSASPEEEKVRALLSAIVFVAILSSAATAEPKDEALQVLADWTKAFADSDVDGIVKLYAPDALFLGTSSRAVVAKSDGIRKYFEAALLANRPRGATLDDFTALTLSDTAVIIAGIDTLTGVREGRPFTANGRVTFVIARRGSDWRIVQFHRSAMPN
jgi:uncharacterized protein (TIGR02246 family)